MSCLTITHNVPPLGVSSGKFNKNILRDEGFVETVRFPAEQIVAIAPNGC